MSVLQEYEQIKRKIGYGKFCMIEKYIEEMCPQENIDKYEKELYKYNNLPYDKWLNQSEKLVKKYGIIFLSDVFYKKKEWDKFEKWYHEKQKHKEVKILSVFPTDYYDIKCSAILLIDGEEVANIVASYDKDSLGNEYSETNEEYLKDAFKDLIYLDFDNYLELPKVSECSELLQEIYDSVRSSDSTMCRITNNDWEEFFSDKYTQEDLDNLEFEILKFGLQEIIDIDDGECKIVSYGDLETIFNDDRCLKNTKEKELC